MASTRSFPSRDVLRRPKLSLIDVVFVAIALLLIGIVRLARSINTSSATAHVAVSYRADDGELVLTPPDEIAA
jgi:hypothetical protein